MAVALVGLAVYGGMTAAGYAASAGIASMAAQGLAQMAFAKKTRISQEGGKLTDLKMATSALGVGIPVYYGTMRGAGNMIYGPPFFESKNTSTESSGKGGGGTETTTTTYTYSCNCAFLLGEGTIKGVKRIWAEGELVYDLDLNNGGYVGDLQSKIKVYLGTEDQLPDPTIESTEGVGNVEAYRGWAYIVFTSMQLGPFGNRVPSLTFEVIRSDNNVEFVNTMVQDIDMGNTKWSNAGQYLNKYNSFNKSVVLRVDGSNNKGIVKYNPFIGNIEASYYLPTNDNSSFGTYGTVKNFDFTYDGDILQGGNSNNNSCIFLIDGDTMVPKRKFFKGSFGFKDEEYMFEPTKILFNQKYFEYMGLHFVSSSFGHTGMVQITVQDYDATPMAHHNVGFSKSSAYSYYSHREVSIDSSETSHMGLAWDIDPQDGYIYYVNYQSYQTNPNSGADPSRHLSISRIDPKFVYKNEEELFLIINDTKPNQMTVHYAFFDQTSRSFFVVYTGVDDNGENNYPANRLLKFNVDSKTVIFDVMLTSLAGNVLDQDGNGFNIIYLGSLTHNLATRKLYIQSNTSTQKVDIDLGTQEIYTQTFEKPMEPNFKTNLSYVPDLSTLISCGYQNVNGPQIIKNIGKRFQNGAYNLAEVVTDLATRSGLTVQDIDVSSLTNDLVNGYVIASTTTIRGCLEQLALAYNFDVVETDWKLKFVKCGQPVVKRINYKTLSAGNYSPDMKFENNLITTKQQELELPALVNFTYLDISNDYQQNTQDCARYTVNTKEVMQVEGPMAFEKTQAKNIATRLMWNAWTQRYTYSFETNYDNILLEPCDVLEIETPEKIFKMKITKVDSDGGIMKFTAIAEDAVVFTQNETGSSSDIVKQTIKSLSTTKTYFMDIPIVQDSDNNAGFYIAVVNQSKDQKWPGSSLYSSNDMNGAYNNVMSFYDASTAGSTITLLDNFTEEYKADYHNYVDVTLINGQLSSISEDEFYSGYNTALIGDELIGFKNVELRGPNTYRLSTLLRGKWNTDEAIATHNQGDRFILLNTAKTKRIVSDASAMNALKFYKNPTFGISLNETQATSFKNTAKGLQCYKVNDFQSNRLANGDINMSWKPNIRGNGFLQNNQDVYDPDGDFYEIEVLNTQGTQVLRTIIIDNAKKYTYTNAMQIADFGTVKTSVNMNIYKKNAIIGRGRLLKVIA